MQGPESMDEEGVVRLPRRANLALDIECSGHLVTVCHLEEKQPPNPQRTTTTRDDVIEVRLCLTVVDRP
jgi:hypothetical protein